MQILKYLTVAMLAATTFSVTVATPAEAFSLKRTIRQVIGGNRYDNNCYGNSGYNNQFNQYNNQFGNYNNGYGYGNNYYGNGPVRRMVNRFIGGW
ncbi:MAG: hypothetical protein K2W95_00675 [Candidatus Obscuribacterales bacterium]|nr:hypothetical protein [Candidatus Obscuribacterales bacterium]